MRIVPDSPINNSSEEIVDPLLVGLNDAQRQATTHKDGPLLVLAGPGSGKTRVVTHRVAWLLRQNVRDSQIAALTFTNKAADEMKTRLATLAPGNRVWVGTFHRFCAYLLRYYAAEVGLRENYAIYDVEQSRKLLEAIVPKNALPNGVDATKIASAISWAKNSLVSASDYCATEGSLLGKVVENAYPAYQEALRKANAVDFDDLLFHIATLLKNNPEIRARLDDRFRYVLVDEYQDTNLVQYAIARALSIDYPNLAATGDPDQSIYGWRGANIQNILNFEKDFENAKVVRLEQNYRSVKSVLRVADSVIKRNVYRKDKALFTDNPEGKPPRVVQCYDQQEEAETIAAEIATEIALGKKRPRDYAIFYRMNALSRNLEYALKRYGVPFQLVRGLEFFNRKEVKDVCSYLQLVYNPSDVVSFKRVVNLPARGVGRVSLLRLETYAEERDVSLFEAARDAKKIGGISKRVQKSLGKFVELIDRLGKSLEEGNDLEVVLSLLLKETKYVEFLQNSVKTEEDEQRLANIQELLSEVREFDADFAQIQKGEEQISLFPERDRHVDKLGRFLEQIALVNDVDAWDADDDRVSLMTLHAAKGLEFPVVYMIALEDGVLPHERSIYDKRQLEEERRLLFVGLTRAKEDLRVSHTRFREFRGSYSPSTSSRFLFEFPKTGVDKFSTIDQWFDDVAKKIDADPNADVVKPRLFDRKEGQSQRQALWNAENPQNLEFDEERPDDDFATRGANKTRTRVSFAKRARLEEGIDPESGDDYSQAVPDAYEGIDAPGEEYVDAPSDFEGETIIYVDDHKPTTRPQRETPNRSSHSRFVSPRALSTGSELDALSKRNDDGSVQSSEESRKTTRRVALNAFVRHKKYGVGVVKKLFGPSFARVAVISFLSGAGVVELPVNDPELTVFALGRE